MRIQRQLFLFLLGLAIGVAPAYAQRCATFSIAFLSPGTGFTVSVGQKTDLRLQVNQCGSKQPVVSGTVVVDFSNHDPELSLTHQGNGLWAASWAPANAVDSEVDVTVFVANGSGTDGNQWAGSVRPPQPTLTFSQSTLVFQTLSGGIPSSQTVHVSNNSAEAQSVSIQAAGGSWISVSPSTASIPAGSSAPFQVRVDPGSLTPGSLSGTLTVSGSPPSSTSALVSLSVGAPSSPPLLSLDSYGLSLTMTEGDPPLARTVTLTNSNPVSSTFTAQASTAWVAVSPASGTIPAASSQLLQITVTPGSLPAGHYTGAVTIPSTGGQTSTVSVSLTLRAATQVVPTLVVNATNTIFTAVTGSAAVNQTIQISNQNAVSVSFLTSAFTDTDRSWLTVLPTRATVTANGSISMVLSADPGSLVVGIHTGTLTILIESGNSFSVPVVLIVMPAGPRAGCTPTRLVLRFQAPQSNASVPIGSTADIRVQALDDCGNPLDQTNSVAVASFSNGDSNLSLTNTGGGVFQGAWVPRHGTPQQPVIITATALERNGSSFLSVDSNTFVTLATGTGAPIVSSVISAAAPTAEANLVSPGELVSIFGTLLADCTAISSLPLPSQACGTQVILGDKPLPILYAGPNQINAQIPFDIQINVQLQLTVQRDATLAAALPVVVAGAQPAVFSVNQTGAGQGVVINNSTGQIADSSSPVGAGDVVVLYCAGLGPVTPAVAAGVPVSTVSSTTNPVTLTIGGQPAHVVFAGVTPGFVGLYQVNAIVPGGVTPGNAVPVVLQALGQTSPVITIAVH